MTTRNCKYCGQDKPAKGFRGARCADCEKARHHARTPEQRVEERRRAAQKAGKAYVAGGLAARRAFDLATRPHDGHVVAFQKATAAKARRDQMVAAKPWTAEGLSKAEAFKLRYRLDKEFHIKERLRRQLNKRRKRDDVADMVRAALKRKGNSPTAEKMLGYSLEELRRHIERQFTKGMTWERFMAGEIHIDHIIPQASFDLSNLDEWRRCWSLANLQPLWAADNWRKSDSMGRLV